MNRRMRRRDQVAVALVVTTLPLVLGLGVVILHCCAGVPWRTPLEAIAFCVGFPAAMALFAAASAIR